MATSRNIGVGIDLGTTFSVVAYLDSNGRPSSILNDEGDLLTPSVVLFDIGAIVVGKEAVKALTTDPDRVADFAKREIGNDVYSRPIGGESISPIVIESLILEKLKRDAENRIGPIQSAVITVPAYFNEPRRKATEDAGQLAGLEVLDIINEPTAAAISYGFTMGFLNAQGHAHSLERIVVYDLGGGTFDVTVMEIDGTDFRTLASGGDVYLGGTDWDRRLVDFFATRFMEQFPDTDPRHNPAHFQKLLREAEDAKRALSSRQQLNINIDLPEGRLKLQLTRAEFESLTADLLDRTRFTASRVMKEARLEWKDVTRILLVGGSTRMPAVREMLLRETGIKPDISASADEAVAHGAAIYANLLLDIRAGEEPAMSVQNVNAHDLGVLGRDPTTGRPSKTVLIQRNTALPASETKDFVTAKDNQRTIEINVVEGGDMSGNNATVVGKCVMTDLPPGLPARTRVKVTFEYTSNGRITVAASVPALRRTMEFHIERPTGLDDAEMADWSERIRTRSGLPGFSS
jgi:molecular chaperone DnaK